MIPRQPDRMTFPGAGIVRFLGMVVFALTVPLFVGWLLVVAVPAVIRFIL